MTPTEPGLRRPNMRRIVVVMPSAFTLGNLFFGFWAIVHTLNGEYAAAAPLIERYLARGDVSYLHLHFARRGCYACRVDRN